MTIIQNFEVTSNKFNVHRIHSEPKISSEKYNNIKILTEMPANRTHNPQLHTIPTT
jgi:hypothetical protein